MIEFNHLKERRLSYCEHLTHALQISGLLFISSIAGIIHAIYPDVFVTTMSDNIQTLYDELNNHSEEVKSKDF